MGVDGGASIALPQRGGNGLSVDVRISPYLVG